jgi:hypothetical protein
LRQLSWSRRDRQWSGRARYESASAEPHRDHQAGGTYPAANIVEIIIYGGNIAAHGSASMPVWGKVFSVKGGGGKVGSYFSRRAAIALKRYLESIQK